LGSRNRFDDQLAGLAKRRQSGLIRAVPILPGRRIYGDFLWLGLSQVAILIGRLIGVRLLTELLPTSVYGEMGLVLAGAMLGVTAFASPIVQASMRQFDDASRENHVAALRRDGLRLIGAAWACFAGMALLVYLAIVRGPGVHPAALVAVLGLAALDMVKTFEVGLLNAAHQQRKFALWNALDAWARPLIACVLIFLWGASMPLAIGGTVLGSMLAGSLFWRHRVAVTARGARPAGEQVYHATLLRIAWPLVPFALCAWFVGIADRFALGALDGTSAVGVYIAGYGLASAPFLALSNLLLNVFRPRMYSAHSRGDSRHARKVALAWLAVVTSCGALCFLLLWYFRVPLVALLLAEEFAIATAVIPIVAVAYLLQAVEVVFDTYLLSLKRTVRLLGAQGSAAAVAAVAYLMLIPEHGFIGAAWATVLAQATSLVLSVAFTLHATRAIIPAR
jgi:O-antigen/teichoic acid export membrane protein